MKKSPVFYIFIMLLAATLFAGACFAVAESTAFAMQQAQNVPDYAAASATAKTSGNADISLIHPVAVATIGDCVFVADNVDDGQSVIHGIDISSDTPLRKYIYTTEKAIVNLAEVDGKLYVIYADGVDVLAVGDALEKMTSYTDSKDQGVFDFTYNTLMGSATEFFSTDRIHYRYDGETDIYDGDSRTDGATELLTTSSDDGVYVYFLQGSSSLKRISVTANARGENLTYNESDKLNANGVNFGTTALGLLGMFKYSVNGESGIALFGKNQVLKLDELTAEFSATTVLVSSQEEISDGCFGAGKIVLLNCEYNKLDVYNYDADADKFVLQYSVGTDTITQEVPQTSSFTGFTLAKSLGYPTNIAYKTADEASSVETILIEENFPEEFVILDYDGAENSDFYYVLVGNKFAWIEKSKKAATAKDDAKIQIVNKIDENVTYSAQFVSMGTVKIYELPFGGSNVSDEFTQTVTDPQEVHVLQKFTEKEADGTVVKDSDGNEVVWYYIAYGENFAKRGFELSNNIGNFRVTASTANPDDGDDAIGWKKINASLFEAVKIYVTSDMNADEALQNDAGGEIKLNSGTMIYLIREENGASYVSVLQSDNITWVYGWIDGSRVIERNAMTTNAIVGICILSAAAVLTAIFLSVFVIKHKRKRKVVSSEE